MGRDDASSNTEPPRVFPFDNGDSNPPDVGVPSDNVTLVDVLAALQRSGYDASFASTGEGLIACSHCGGRFRPEDYRPELERRLEGASDPADELLVLAGVCDRCGRRGVLIVGFGPAAGEADAAVVARLPNGGDSVSSTRS